MEQQLCLNPSCQKPIEGKEGKRVKKYCSDKCRASHYSKTHSKKGVKWVKKEVYEAVVKERDGLQNRLNWMTNMLNPEHKQIDFSVVTKDAYNAPPMSRLIMDEIGQMPLLKNYRDMKDVLPLSAEAFDKKIERMVAENNKPDNKARILAEREKKAELPDELTKRPLSSKEVANNGIVINKGYNTYLSEVRKAKTIKELEALHEEIYNNTSLHDNDKYKLVNAINAKKLTFKQ